jgi:transketolase
MAQDTTHPEMLQKIADTLRCLAMDAVQKANSGHPGMPMGCAEFAALLWGKMLKYDPRDPFWPDRDRFVLSAGHGSALLYAVLHLAGYDLSLEDLKDFRQWNSRTPGHPEAGCAPGVETTTGPLGQGFGNGVGMALAEAMLAETFNRDGVKVVDHFIYGLAGDGDLMEGVSAEAASLAGHLGLGKLIYFYDDNHITIDGATDLTFSDDTAQRFEGYNWHVQIVDGHDMQAMERALLKAQQETARPSLIIGHTHIAKGSPNKQDTADAHGAPLGEEEVKMTKEGLGWPLDPSFYVPPEVMDFFGERAQELAKVHESWKVNFDTLGRENPGLREKWNSFIGCKLPEDLDSALPDFKESKPMATRVASGVVLNHLAEKVENLVGGSADLSPSNKTFLKDFPVLGPGCFKGRNLHFGVREHAMGAVMNGMALHGGFIPYGGTFLVFSDYMRPSIRMAALSRIPVIYVFTHDSIFVGEDGPTHQPVEHLAALRAIPNLAVIRPADAAETAQAWKTALLRKDGPTALILSRQGLPIMDRNKYAAPDVERGAYCLRKEFGGSLDLLIIATGSEVSLALEAVESLAEKGQGVRLVSMPSWECFQAQSKTYRDEVIPPACQNRLIVEAGSPLGWERYAGAEGRILGIDRFGASAPARVMAEHYGYTPGHMLETIKSMLPR